MTEEIQNAEQEALETNVSPDEQPTSEQKDDGSKKLEEMLQREREAREKAEKALAEKAFKAREQKRLQEDDIEEQDEYDKPLTYKDLPAILAKEREATRKELLNAEIKRLATRSAENEVQRDLIIEIHKNRHFPEHLTLEEQLDECFLIANKDRILGQNYELKRALAKKASNDSTGDYQVSQKGNEPKMASADAAEYARMGLKYNSTNKRWEKKLANGKTLVKDPKTGTTTVV